MHLPKDFCAELKKVDAARQESEEIIRNINETHEQLNTGTTQTDLHWNKLRKFYDEAIKSGEREEKGLRTCLEKLDDMINSAKKRQSAEVTKPAAKSKKVKKEDTATTPVSNPITPTPVQKPNPIKDEFTPVQTSHKTQKAKANTSSSSYLYPEDENIVPIGSQIAAEVSQGFWILASVVKYFPDKAKKYEVEDEDPGDDNDPNPVRKHYLLTPANVIALPKQPHIFGKGTQVLAMFPDTTTFYTAVVAQPPNQAASAAGAKVAGNKRTKKGGSSTMQGPGDYLLMFDDDEEEFRAVNFKYVLPPPK